MHNVCDYVKIASFEEAKKIPPEKWHCIFEKNKLTRGRSRRKFRITIALSFKQFEECIVKVDGILGKLITARVPPKGSIIIFDDGGLHCCPIDKCFNIYLPLK